LTGAHGVGHAFYAEWESMSIDRPSIATSRCTGDSVDSLAGFSEDPEGMPGAITVHIFGQSSMGNGASNIDGGIIALN
jgi:hypothetical protein